MNMTSLLLCLVPIALFAQDPTNPQAPVPPPVSSPTPELWANTNPGWHRHDGFYLSMNIGAALGGTIINASGDDRSFGEAIYRGGGSLIDLKIGGAIQENLILSFDIIGRTISGPELEVDNVNMGSGPENFSVIDNSYGIGLTRYFMPHNVFVSGSLSTARMVIQDTDNDNTATSQWGYAIHLKVGKEWWVGTNWGLGISGGYGFASAKDKEPPSGIDYSGDIKSHQFYILFNTTYN